MTQIHFTHWEGNHPRLYCIWCDELKFFPDESAARAWASRQGLRAVFPESSDGNRSGSALAPCVDGVSGADGGGLGSDALNPLYMYGIGYELEDG